MEFRRWRKRGGEDGQNEGGQRNVGFSVSDKVQERSDEVQMERIVAHPGPKS